MSTAFERMQASKQRSVLLHKRCLQLRLNAALLTMESEELLLLSQLERHLRRQTPFKVPPQRQS